MPVGPARGMPVPPMVGSTDPHGRPHHHVGLSTNLLLAAGAPIAPRRAPGVSAPTGDRTDEPVATGILGSTGHARGGTPEIQRCAVVTSAVGAGHTSILPGAAPRSGMPPAHGERAAYRRCQGA